MCQLCSQTKIQKYKWKTKTKKNTIKKNQDGTHSGWQSRKIKSYAEKFFIMVLTNNNLLDKCIIEYLIKKKKIRYKL